MIKPQLDPAQEEYTEAAVGKLKNQEHDSEGFKLYRFLDSHNFFL